jgi:hypothetical protein
MARHRGARAHPGQARTPAPVQPHDEGFGLIVGMVRGDQRAQPFGPQPVPQRGIARRPRRACTPRRLAAPG